MPKYRVGLYFTFRVDYEVEEPDQAAAEEEAHRLCNLDSDMDLATRADGAITLEDTIAEEIF